MALFVRVISYVNSGARTGRSSQHRDFVTSLIDQLIAFVSANAWLAYLTLFLAALLEAVPVVGSVIPGSTIILALSALVPGGELNLWWVLAAAIAGALLGDGSAFWIGHRSQREDPRHLAADQLSARGGAERGILPPLGYAGRCSSRASCRRSAPSCRSRRARSACRRRDFTRSTFRRFCCGRRPMCCRAWSRFPRSSDMACFAHTGGSAETFLDADRARRSA